MIIWFIYVMVIKIMYILSFLCPKTDAMDVQSKYQADINRMNIDILKVLSSRISVLEGYMLKEMEGNTHGTERHDRCVD